MERSNHVADGSRCARPCDTCRKRKRRCVTEAGQLACRLCRAGAVNCTFTEQPADRGSLKRPAPDQLGELPARQRVQNNEAPTNSDSHMYHDAAGVIEDYDSLPMPSLLKTNLGLQQHRYIRYIGPSDELDPDLLALRPVDTKQEIQFSNGTNCRRVSRHTHFALVPYSRTRVRAQEIQELDTIEKIVAPHGKSLVKLYFRMVHPCFPILDKKTFMEKYTRTHREFSSPCLAGVYMLAAKWWHHDRELSAQKKPEIDVLERIARTSLQSAIDRPKLSTLQGGLLLLQHAWSDEGAWALSAQMVAVAQDLGIDSNCAGWTIPTWESGLRRRLGWAIFMMDKWMALCRGRPSHIVDDDWTPEPLAEEELADIEEREEAEDTIEGSVDVVAGGKAFEWMILLTHIISRILQKFYSRKALADKSSNIRTVLEQIKPIQVRLREWHRDLPASLQLHASESQRLSPNASLHLAYFAAEVTLHRVILRSLFRHPCDPYIVQICRGAAEERVTSAVDLVARLKGQHLQAFWYSSSGYCLVTIGTFTALMFITSQSTKEAEKYKKTLSNYRWLLRVNSRATEYMDFAVQRLDLSLSHVHELTAEDIVGQSTPAETEMPVASSGTSSPRSQAATAPQAGQASASEERPGEQAIQWTQQNGPSEGFGDSLLTSFLYEDAVLSAMENLQPQQSSSLRQHQLPPSLYPMSPAFDAAGATTRTLEYDYQQSEQGDIATGQTMGDPFEAADPSRGDTNQRAVQEENARLLLRMGYGR